MEDIVKKLSQTQLDTASNDNVSCCPVTTIQVDDCKSQIDLPLTDYLLPVHKEYLKKMKPNVALTDVDTASFKVDVQLKENLYHYIWSPDVFRASRPQLQRIYDEISAKLTVSADQSDLDDMLQYLPVDVVSSKFIQLVVGIAMVEPNLVEKDFNHLDELLKNERIIMDSSAFDAYEFILHTAKRLFKVLAGDQKDETLKHQQQQGSKHFDYQDLNRESKGIIKGLSAMYLKPFRVKPKERFDKLKHAVENVPGRVEWVLYAAESLRMKRRDETRNLKRTTPEEMELVEQSLKMEGDNPFVRFNVIECVVDAVRETNGRFHCGHIHLHDTEQAMRFLREECTKLCEDFPRNVCFLSGVSDFFARYVPFLYFDKELSGKLLHNGYQLNQRNPKTTHRLSIFYRMHLKNVQESLEWLETTLKLDPTFFNANMDYYKTILGKPEKYCNVGEQMEEKLKSTDAPKWRDSDLSEFKFYIGLAYFAEGRKEDTIKIWTEVMKQSELNFPLSGVDSDCSIFRWNTKFISTDKIREWMQSEWQQMKTLGKSVNFDSERKRNIERMFHLMLGAVPKRPDPIASPYSQYFKHALQL